jgi:hypothetical protein
MEYFISGFPDCLLATLTDSADRSGRRAKAWVCGSLLTGVSGSNPAQDMGISLLRMLCVVRYRSLRLANDSSTGVLPNVVFVNVIVKSQ